MSNDTDYMAFGAVYTALDFTDSRAVERAGAIFLRAVDEHLLNALDAFRSSHGVDRSDVIGDLGADMLHWADQNDINWTEAWMPGGYPAAPQPGGDPEGLNAERVAWADAAVYAGRYENAPHELMRLLALAWHGGEGIVMATNTGEDPVCRRDFWNHIIMHYTVETKA
jgi:hypothetical protein